jgi:hypothetical protein
MPQSFTADEAPMPTSEDESSSPVSSSSPLEEKWHALVDKIKKVNSVMAAKLEHLHVVAINNTDIELGVPEKYKFLFSQVSEDGFKKKLSNYTSTFWGNALAVTVKELGSKTTAANMSVKQITEKKSDDEKRQIETDIENHPLVKSAKSLFNTQITSIKEKR